LKAIWFRVLFGPKEVCYVRQLKVHVILGQFSVLNFFLLSLLSLAFVLGFDIKKTQREYCNQDFMNFNEVLWQKKKKIQKKRWYQKERNKEISVLKKETKSLSRILGKIQQELDVLTILVDAQQTSEREEQKHCNDDRRKRTVVTFIQSCW
jgi:septal ring factor EnvC (AmiA/AmiB activator)